MARRSNRLVDHPMHVGGIQPRTAAQEARRAFLLAPLGRVIVHGHSYPWGGCLVDRSVPEPSRRSVYYESTEDDEPTRARMPHRRPMDTHPYSDMYTPERSIR
jgi:hypothetical protein